MGKVYIQGKVYLPKYTKVYLQGKVYLLFSIILKQNDYPSSFLGNSCIPFFNLYLFMYFMK